MIKITTLIKMLGGLFILKNDKTLEATSENRRIHNVGVWKE